MRPLTSLVLALLPLVGTSAAASEGGAPRVLLIVADDLGVDRVGAYGEHPDPGHTPNIDRLAARGVLFRHCWAAPVCATARATILTGLYPLHSGIGKNIPSQIDPFDLDPALESLPDVLGTTSAAFGKWHVGDETDLDHPLATGFDTFAGTVGNLAKFGGDYFHWRKVENGMHVWVDEYATTTVGADAIASDADFKYVAFHAPHAPLHDPPDDLHGYGDPTDDATMHRAMVEAMDTVIGRLLVDAGPETLVVVVGDNGTDEAVTDGPFDPEHAKGTLYEGGIRVPLIVAGPGVAHGESRALVQTTDLFATLAELVGRLGPTDSVSLWPYLRDPAHPSERAWTYAERFKPNGFGRKVEWDRAIRDDRFKLIRSLEAPDRLFDLEADPMEQVDLLRLGPTPAQSAAYGRLSHAMERIAGSG